MKSFLFLPITILLFLSGNQIITAQSAPSFSDAQTFAVLGSATITSTGPTIITGNIGVSPGTAITGFPPGIVQNGQLYSGVGSIAGPAMASANTVYYNLQNQIAPAANNLTGKVLGETAGAITLTPGIYTFSSSAQLNATLTLNDLGDPNSIFIFKIGSTITTASGSKVVMSSGGKGKNVFWQIGSSATIGTNTSFCGHILALASITMTAGATTTGKLFALNGATTMDSNGISNVSDVDNDGIADNLDDFPEDNKKAFNNPSSAEGSTIAFEDLWPYKGDFDMNDMVMNYKYNVVTNAQNVVVEVIGNFTLLATGGSIQSGFGVQFPISPLTVDSLQGGNLEPGQEKAVVVLFTNMHDEMAFGNTQPGLAPKDPKHYTIKFKLINGPLLSDFGTDFNPFIFNYVGQSRREMHQTGKPPTTLADNSLFGTQDDNTNIAAGRYYVTKSGLPYTLNLSQPGFNYPIEGKDITQAYLHFAEWAASGGTVYKDWYTNLADGYRNNLFIYTK